MNTSSRVYAQSMDEGLRAYMLRVYNHMGLGLTISGLVSYFVGTNEVLYQTLMTGPMAWLFILSPLAIILIMAFGMEKLSTAMSAILFYVFATLMGVSLSTIFVVYQLGSIFQVFLITAVMFGSMSLYGYTTKRDLTSIGSFLIMGLIGLILASLVNLWFQNPIADLVISAIGVLVFVGLTAYDTQKIKDIYYYADDSLREKLAINGALTLYLDFINLMMNLLRLMGERK